MPVTEEFNIDIDVRNYLNDQKLLIDNHLTKLLTEDKNFTQFTQTESLWNAVRYSVLNGGKRIRGVLCLATFESFTNSNEKKYFDDCLTTACSIELIHAMSLIHDDLPCMDNDDLRRGKPSCHKAFGEATAILAGDAMLTFAFYLISKKTKNISDSQKLKLINILSDAFHFGLVPGQILDIEKIEKSGEIISLNDITEIAKLKTAALIKAAILCGALISEETLDTNILKTLESASEKIGIAFQIIDDVLDVTSDTKTLGKTSGKDEKQKKSTFPKLLGLDNSKKMAQELIVEAKGELTKLPLKNSLLFSMANILVSRIN